MFRSRPLSLWIAGLVSGRSTQSAQAATATATATGIPKPASFGDVDQLAVAESVGSGGRHRQVEVPDGCQFELAQKQRDEARLHAALDLEHGNARRPDYKLTEQRRRCDVAALRREVRCEHRAGWWENRPGRGSGRQSLEAHRYWRTIVQS